MQEIYVSPHAVERFKTRVFWGEELKTDTKIEEFLKLAFKKGDFVGNCPDRAEERRYQGVYFIVKNNCVITVLGDKKYRSWAKKESRPRLLAHF